MESAEVEIVWNGSRRRAELLLSAISPDDPELFFVEIIDINDSAKLKLKVTSTSLKNIRSTIDDILVCLAAADMSLEVVEKRKDK
jgi:hypothetical protein|tara:strand:- start:631 stop:885 length:255 start_codon:yes stop_codon:yes gene_type:complete